MKIEGYELTNYGGYYSNKDLSVETHQNDGPLIEIEKMDSGRWQACIMNGPWNENLAFSRSGTFIQAKKHLAKALREEQHIYL